MMEKPSSKRRQATRSLSQPRQFNISASPSPNTASYPIPITPSPLSSALGNTAASPRFQTEQKVPIPRLQRPGPKQVPSGPDRQRVSHACEPCRRRKSKCDGLQPLCGRCRDQEIHCFYADGKREKLKRNARTMAAKVERYESLLTELLPAQDINRQQDIRNALSESRFNEDESASGDDANEDEHSVSATVASPRFQDRAQQNTTRSVGSAGYLGKSSVVHWIEELMIKLVASSLVLEAHDLSLGSFDPLTTMDNEANLPETGALLMQDCTYFSGEIPQSQLSGISQSINAALQLPPKSTGELLIRSYFSTVHPVFPIIPEEDFVFQYHSYYQTTQPPNGSCLWVAILNVVFAIGALYTRYVQIPCERLEDHIIYWIRSRVLGQEPIQMTGLPTMEHIRLLTISGMYCIASYQINRASYLIALGVRYAYSRALHLANTDPNITDEERELQVKVWHSLCSIERLLSFLTGLPSSIQDRFISVRLPRANDTYPSLNPAVGHLGAQAISGSRKGSLSCHLNTFVASLRLDSIVSEALSALYSSSTVNRTWARVQQTVVDLDRKLAHWQSDLTPGLIISPEHDNIAITPLIERMYLSLRFLGARMLINRPSLCDIYELNAAIPSQSEASRRLDTDAAVRCISAARSLVQLLPAHFDAAEFYRSTPWWCALNYLIQAGVVLMMEISFDAQHIPAETDDIITESILVIRWLETLSATSDPARRACLSLNRLLKLALDKVGRHPGNNLPFPSDASSTPQTVPPTGLHFTGHESNFLSGTNWHPACPP